MNISELARRLKITTNQLHEVLPHMGLSVGHRAIKIDDKVANRIMRDWGKYAHILEKQQAEEEAAAALPVEKLPVALPAVITVRDFAVLLNLPVTKLVHTLMNNGILAALNEKIDYDTAAIIAEDLGFIPEKLSATQDEGPQESVIDPITEVLSKEPPESLAPRSPIVVVMGHVDHGKTTLLDAIRETNVISQESGGITQHIGAYQTFAKMKKTGDTRPITFLDTPGHEAFTTMRSRGARVADIAILVVAADDGVKPQTIEAIKIIQSAQTPLIVAINKIDKEGANLDRVKRELSDNGLIPEDYGGTTVCVPISARNRTGIDDLLDVILIVAEMEKGKIVANPTGATVATVIESHVDKNEGPVATILVQNGTLKLNDFLVIESTLYGKVRAMRDYHGVAVKSAGPSQPVKIIGFKAAPVIGHIVSASVKLDPTITKEAKRGGAAQSVVVTPRHSSKDTGKSVNIILKTDTLGSLEAIANALVKIDNPEVKVKIISKGLGAIATTDVLNAETTGGFIAGFHVDISQSAQQLSQEKNIPIKIYKIIYELLDEVKEKIEALLAPEINRIVVGTAKVLAIFRTEGSSMIIGGAVTEGSLEPKLRVQVIRQGEVVAEGKITGLQAGKQAATSVQSGQEFGLSYEGKPLIQVNDIIQAYREERIKRTLE